MKLFFYPKYTQKGPSSRYRMFQYLPYLSGYSIETFPFFDDNYNTGMSFKTIRGVVFVLKCYFKRFLNLAKIKKNDIAFVQYEFTQFLPFNVLYFKLFKIKYIVDFDDAAFHEYDQHSNKLIRFLFKDKIAKVIKHSHMVITGSPYLTVYARKFNKKVIEIPTSIDLEKYDLNNNNYYKEEFIIGWIGSKTTSKNLLQLIPIFKKLKEKKVNYRLYFVGFDSSLKEFFVGLPVRFLKWDAETEVINIKNFTVGIMPLEDNLFNKGKCGFKLIQYMACGIPTISSSFDANIKIDRNKENLFVDEIKDWEGAILEIFNNREKYFHVGMRNKKVVDEYYSVQSNYKKYIKVFSSLI